jgi:diadenosine tetraphosphate (Ap4A) HIT family hydrolase
MNSSGCEYCGQPVFRRVIYKDDRAVILAPVYPHLSKADGGHLIAYPQEHVTSRLTAGPRVILEVSYMSIVAADAMKKLLGVEWFNFQENSNWSLADPCGPHMHVHIYGRSKNSPHQEYGEALVLPRRADVARLGHEPFSEDEIRTMTRLVTETIRSGDLADFQHVIRLANSIGR